MSNNRKGHRSYSQLKMIRSCPKKYELLRIRNVVPFQPSAAAVQGSAFHSAYEQWETSGRSWSPSQLGALYKATYYSLMRAELKKTDPKGWKVWGKRTFEEDVKIREGIGSEQIIDYAKLCISECNEWKVWRDPAGDLALELAFSVDLGGSEVIGSIDVVREMTDGTLRVRDLKTGGRENTGIQLGIYRHALKDIFGVDSTVGDFYYAKDGVVKIFDLRNFTKEYLSGQFRFLEDTIAKNTWMARPSPECFSCEAMSRCPEFKEQK